MFEINDFIVFNKNSTVIYIILMKFIIYNWKTLVYDPKLRLQKTSIIKKFKMQTSVLFYKKLFSSSENLKNVLLLLNSS